MALVASRQAHFKLLSEIFKDKKVLSSVLSVLIHVMFLILIKQAYTSVVVESPAVENYVDLGYQQFDDTPEIVNSERQQVKNEPIVQDKIEPVASTAHEMQDQASDVSGLQKEVKPTVASATNVNTSTVPYYKIKPKYPQEALESNIEGYVLMKIDISEDGSVENVKVTGGEKVSLFETAAMRAVAKWKYKSFLDEQGNPTKKTDYMVRVDFKIKDEAINQ